MEIIATVKDVETARRLAGACAPDYFRVNASHMDAAALGAFCRDYAADPLLARLPLYVDLQGAKLRVDRSQPPVDIAAGQTVTLCDAANKAAAADCDCCCVLVSRTVLELISAGTVVAIDDGKLAIRVDTVGDGRATATVLRGGRLLPGKGFNLRPHPVTHAHLNDRDRAIVAATRGHACVRYALSFACLPSEVAELRELAGADAKVAVKLERPLDSDDQVLALGREAGELWVCRGDMTVQLGGFGELARFYRHFVAATLPALRAQGCRVVMAGEVLEHMCDCPEPTRSEACHLADLHTAGFVGIVVSNETAVGKHPEKVLQLFRDVTAALV